MASPRARIATRPTVGHQPLYLYCRGVPAGTETIAWVNAIHDDATSSCTKCSGCADFAVFTCKHFHTRILQTHRNLYTQTVLHWSIYTQTPLYTHRRLYTQMVADAFTILYTQTRPQRRPCTQGSWNMETMKSNFCNNYGKGSRCGRLALMTCLTWTRGWLMVQDDSANQLVKGRGPSWHSWSNECCAFWQSEGVSPSPRRKQIISHNITYYNINSEVAMFA